VFSSDDAAALVRSLYLDGETNDSLIAEELLDSALEKGTMHELCISTQRLQCYIIGCY
jgi:hypothetical protein